jgi:hypothetical protein
VELQGSAPRRATEHAEIANRFGQNPHTKNPKSQSSRRNSAATKPALFLVTTPSGELLDFFRGGCVRDQDQEVVSEDDAFHFFLDRFEGM